MALGLSVIFGVMRLVNFAHGELMTLAMYAAVVAVSGRSRSIPSSRCCGRGRLFAAFGYAMQRGFINRFIRRPSTPSMLLMIALAMIIGERACCSSSGPTRATCRPSYQLDSFELGPLLLDKDASTRRAPRWWRPALLAAFFRLTLTGKAIRACADNPVGAQRGRPARRAPLRRHLRSRRGLRRGGRLRDGAAAST